MGFPRRLLNDHEEIVLDLRPHWWFMVGPVTAVVVGIAAGIAAWNAPAGVRIALGILLLVAAGWLAVRAARWLTTSFVVTTDRLIFRHGVLAKRGIEIPLERVNNVIFSQSLFERILGSGDLLIESAGESGQQRFSDIRHPEEVQSEIHRQMEDNENRKFDRAAGGRTLTIPEQIEKLAELRDRGAISDAEYEAAKRDLLDRL